MLASAAYLDVSWTKGDICFFKKQYGNAIYVDMKQINRQNTEPLKTQHTTGILVQRALKEKVLRIAT